MKSILGLAFTVACLATAQVNIMLSVVFAVIGMIFLLRG